MSQEINKNLRKKPVASNVAKIAEFLFKYVDLPSMITDVDYNIISSHSRQLSYAESPQALSSILQKYKNMLDVELEDKIADFRDYVVNMKAMFNQRIPEPFMQWIKTWEQSESYMDSKDFFRRLDQTKDDFIAFDDAKEKIAALYELRDSIEHTPLYSSLIENIRKLNIIVNTLEHPLEKDSGALLYHLDILQQISKSAAEDIRLMPDVLHTLLKKTENVEKLDSFEQFTQHSNHIAKGVQSLADDIAFFAKEKPNPLLNAASVDIIMADFNYPDLGNRNV